MASRFLYEFQPIGSTAGPGFNSTLGSSGLYALESSDAAREWQHPTSRAVSISCYTTGSNKEPPFYLTFGTSVTALATSTAGQQFLANERYLVHLDVTQSYVAVKSSTDVVVNFALGYGG